MIEKITFQATDGIILDGLIYLPSKKKNNTAVISVHGMTSNCFGKRNEEIAKKLNEEGYSYLAFNNRGQELSRYIRKYVDGKKVKQIAGTTYEDVLDSYFDITGAIQYMLSLGYEKVILQGHSLGCTKIVYTYQKIKEEQKELLDRIEKVILLSLIDIPGVQKIFLGSNYEGMLEYAIKKKEEGLEKELMPTKAFIHPISVKTYLRYFKENQAINFAQYGNEKYQYPELNAIKVPLMMRFGTDREMIFQSANELVRLLKEKINNPKFDVGYIEGADHSYTGKEEILAREIRNFILE